MRVFILGSTGMLGSYISSYLKKEGFDIVGITRKDMDIENITNTGLQLWFELHGGIYINDVVVNCIGLIKQKMTDSDSVSAIRINSIFPHLISSLCVDRHARLIHMSTDSVFSGTKGDYIESDVASPTDMYGITKLAGEPTNCSVIRSSVIGEENSGVSLLEWVKKTKEIRGFTNHYWNGVTCLQLAKCIEEIIINALFWSGIRHYFSEPVTKAQLVRYIADVYDTGSVITDAESDTAVNRILFSEYDVFKQPSSIYRQIIEQKNWIK